MPVKLDPDGHPFIAAAALPALFAVRSLVAPGGDFGRNLSGYFVAQAPVPITGGGLLSLRVAPGELWTLTTVGAMRKGAPASAVPATAPFPGAYADSFDACAPPQEAAFFTDMTGVFECARDDAGPAPRRGTG